jgi:hypothetical protein
MGGTEVDSDCEVCVDWLVRRLERYGTNESSKHYLGYTDNTQTKQTLLGKIGLGFVE